MWAAANTAFATCPELSSGAVEALETHATPELRELYMPRMLSGEWTVTMCLTEPQAGSDLAVIQTRAEPHGDRFRLFGRKIFITWGDHELTPNIVHMVLAKAPHAPPGVKGISLFLVPKYRVAPGRQTRRAQRHSSGIGRAQARPAREPDLRPGAR